MLKASCQNGFTLVELMITVVIAAILLAVAAPGFVELLERNRMESAASGIYGSLMLARSEALKRNETVVMCRRDTSTGKCASGSSGNWVDGWVVHPAADPNEVLVSREGMDSGDTLWVVQTDDPTKKETNVSFAPSGGASTKVSFVLCNSAADTDSGREVQIELTGRPRIKGDPSDCLP